MSKPLYIFLSFDLGQRRVRLKPLKRDRVVDDGSTLGRASANLTRRFEAVSPKQELLPNFELDCLITLSDKYLKEVGEVTVLQKEIAQPQVVIQPDGRINIPKKEDGSVWTLEELREKMKWSRWPMFDELEPLFRRWWELRYKNRFHRYWTVEELIEMKDIQQFLGLDCR